MKPIRAALAGASILIMPATATAQTTPDAEPAVVMQPAVSATPAIAPLSGPALRVGTEVPLALSEELTTKGKKLRAGARFRMETTEAVLVHGVTVIPAGSPAVGEITNVRNKGMWGKSGRFVARILYVTVNGRQIRLSGGFTDKGTAGGIGAVAVSAIIIPVAGFFMTGTSAKLPVGTPVKGFVDEDVPLAMAVATPAPLVVVAPSVPAALPVPAAPGGEN